MYGIKDYVHPVAGKFRVTSGEGNRKRGRNTNGTLMSGFHHGVDIAGPVPGSKPDILNITGGKVVWTGVAGGWGKTVIVQNPDGYTVQYGHLDSISVKPGDSVPAGGKIGVMGATGNVTGVHLDMIVTKNGKSIKRDGSVLAAAPASIARRAGNKFPAQADGSTVVDKKDLKIPGMPVNPFALTDQMLAAQGGQTGQGQVGQVGQVGQGGTAPYAGTATSPDTDLFASNPIQSPLNLLSGSVGVAVPTTETENQLFGNIANMGFDKSLESIYAEAARAIASAKDSIASQPMVQSTNPLRSELSSIFDSISV